MGDIFTFRVCFNQDNIVPRARDTFGIKIIAMISTRTTLSFLIICLSISGLTVLSLTMLAPAWETWRPATCMPISCFCEAIRFGHSVQQPANTWSSLGFVIVGSLILALARNTRTTLAKSRLTKGYTIIFGVSIILIGVGSAFYHASLTLVGQFFDVFGMYLLTSFMLVYALDRLFDFKSPTTLIIYVVLNLALSTLLIQIPETRRYMFALVLIAALIFEFIMRRRKKISIQVGWWNAGFLLLAVAYVIWILDITKILCDPQSPLQGHAIWHILGAVAVWLLYRYYASEPAVRAP